MLSDIDRGSIVSLASSAADRVYEDAFEEVVIALAEEPDLGRRRLLRDKTLDLVNCYVSAAARAAVEFVETYSRRQREAQGILAGQLERYNQRERSGDDDPDDSPDAA